MTRRRTETLVVAMLSAAALAPLLVASTPMGARSAARHALVEITARVHETVTASAGVQTVPADLSPALSEAGTDLPQPWTDGCLLQWTPVVAPPCVAGDTTSPVTIAVFGDSHAAQWFPALDEIARHRHWRLRTLTKVVCPPLAMAINLPYLHREYTECEQWRTAAVEALRAEHPALVILDMRRFYDRDSWWVQTYDPHWLQALSAMVGTLRAAGSAVLVLGPLPEPGTDVPHCAALNSTSLSACNPLRSDAVDAAGVAAERVATLAAGGDYIDLTPIFCAGTRCPVVVDDTLVYVDNDHLTASYVRFLTPVLSAVLDTLPAPATQEISDLRAQPVG